VTSSAIEYRLAKDNDRDAILALLAAKRDPGDRAAYVADRTSFWNWLHIDNPAADDESPLFVIAEEGATVVGAFGVIPARALVDGLVRTVYWTTDLVVQEEMRGRGVGKKLLHEVFGLRDVCLTGTMTDQAMLMHERAGSRSIGLVRHLILLNSVVSFSGFTVWLRNRYRSWKIEREVGPEDFAVEQCSVEEIGDEFDELWSRKAPEIAFGVVRDRRYMQWRYAEHPSNSYECLIARRENRLCGVVVLRVRRSGGTTRGRIIDVIVPRSETILMPVLLARAIQWFQSRGVHDVDALSADVEFQNLLQEWGFVNLPESENRHLTLNSAEGVDVNRLLSTSAQWLISLGDTDNDVRL